MKRIFFAGNHIGGGGPREVNKGYVRNLGSRVMSLNQGIRFFLFIELIYKILICNLVIFSGISSVDHLLLPLCRIFKKKVIYIMHGWLRFEDNINGVTNNRGEKNEELMLKSAHQILCVSKLFCNLIKKEYPTFSHKISYLTNGIDWENLNQKDLITARDSKRIVLIGGGRVTKRNLEVCKAVKLLNEKEGMLFHIDVYGIFEKNDDSSKIAAMPYTIFHDVIPHEQILNVFASSFLFVQNSDFEPFSLGVVESLVCGCSILISKNVGARDIIPGLTDDDIITDTSDIEQIANKIMFLYKSGNAKRLIASIDKEKTSIKSASDRLYEIANQILSQ